MTIATLRDQAGDLAREHYLEVEPEPRPALDVDWLRLQALEQKDATVSLGAYLGEELVGYAVSIVYPHLHFAGTLYCQNGALFVGVAARGRRLGLRLIEETERVAVGMGAKRVQWHARRGGALQALLQLRGYVEQSITYSKGV